MRGPSSLYPVPRHFAIVARGVPRTVHVRSKGFAAMVKFIACSLWLTLGLVAGPAWAQSSAQPDSLGLPGDNLNLYAVLKIFQESPTLEEFEKKLNDADAEINNLDLDGDNWVDYIRVVDNVVDGQHVIVLQVPVTEKEAQDVAVINVDKDEHGRVRVQLVGDELLYGKDYIIEPQYDVVDGQVATSTPNPGYTGPEPVAVTHTTTVQVAAWPVVQYIYVPTYDPWISPWHYGYFPPYWQPWSPFYWHAYWGYHYHHQHYYWGHYRRTPYYRNTHLHTYYGGRRHTSVVVVDRQRSGGYKSTYSKPQTRKDGLDLYNKKHPGVTARPLPGAGTGKPALHTPAGSKPAHPSGKPAVTPPAGNKSTHPGTKPPVTPPAGGKPAVTVPPGSKQAIPGGQPTVKSPTKTPSTPPGSKTAVQPPASPAPGSASGKPAVQPAAPPKSAATATPPAGKKLPDTAPQTDKLRVGQPSTASPSPKKP
jgi:hypothetical protein